VVLKLQILPEQLELLADGSPTQNRPSMSDDFNPANETDPLPEKIFIAIRTNGSLNEITVAEFIEQNGKVQ